MYTGKHSELINRVLGVFPDSFVVNKSELESIPQIQNTAKKSSKAAKRVKPQRSGLRTSKRNFIDPRQQSFLDGEGNVK